VLVLIDVSLLARGVCASLVHNHQLTTALLEKVPELAACL
jgi:hypothetical protein